MTADLQQFLNLPADLLSALGRAQEASRAISAELRKARQEMRDVDAAGGTVSNAQRQRVLDLQAQQAAIKADLAARSRSNAERATLNALVGRGRRLAELPMRLSALRGGIAVENVADIGHVMRGLGTRLLASESMLAQRAGALLSRGGASIVSGALGVTAIGAVAAMATHAATSFLAGEIERDKQAAQIRAQTADALRTGDFSAEEAELIRASGNRAFMQAMAGSVGGRAKMALGYLGIGSSGTEKALSLAQRQQKQEIDRIKMGKQLGAAFMAETALGGDRVYRAARRAVDAANAWDLSYDLRKNLDLTGEEMLAAQLTEQERIMRTVAAQRSARDKAVDTPENRVAIANRVRHLSAVEADRVARINDWNPY